MTQETNLSTLELLTAESIAQRSVLQRQQLIENNYPPESVISRICTAAGKALVHIDDEAVINEVTQNLVSALAMADYTYDLYQGKTRKVIELEERLNADLGPVKDAPQDLQESEAD